MMCGTGFGAARVAACDGSAVAVSGRGGPGVDGDGDSAPSSVSKGGAGSVAVDGSGVGVGVGGGDWACEAGVDCGTSVAFDVAVASVGSDGGFGGGGAIDGVSPGATVAGAYDGVSCFTPSAEPTSITITIATEAGAPFPSGVGSGVSNGVGRTIRKHSKIATCSASDSLAIRPRVPRWRTDTFSRSAASGIDRLGPN